MLLELIKDRNNALFAGDLSRASFLSIRIAHLAAAENSLDPYESLSDLNFIKEAIRIYDEYKQNISSIELALAGQYLEVVFDCRVPSSWNLVEDLFVVDSKIFSETKFLELYSIIGQQRFLFVRSEKSSENHVPGEEFDTDLTLKHLGPVLPGRIAFLLQPDSEDAKLFEKGVREGLTRLKVMRNTISCFEEIWLENIIEGIPYFSRSHCASELKRFFLDKEVLVISPGPSLMRCGDALKKMRSKFILLAVAQSIPALVKLGITPDFVMVVDPFDYSNALLGLDLDKVKGLIAYEAIHKNFLSARFREIFIISPPSSPIANFQMLGGQPIQLSGCSVSVQACGLAIALGASMVGLLGQDLCLQRGLQYAVESSDGQSVASGDIETDCFGEFFLRSKFDGTVRKLYTVEGQDGETLFSPADYYMYRTELEMIAVEFSKVSDVRLINFSKGGAQVNGFENQELETYITRAIHSDELILQNKFDYLRRLDLFASDCLKRNREFERDFENLQFDNSSIMSEFLSIPSIRCFGKRDLVDFFSGFEASIREDIVVRNEDKLKKVMEASLEAHRSFFERLKSRIDALSNDARPLLAQANASK